MSMRNAISKPIGNVRSSKSIKEGEKLAHFLTKVADAWKEGTQEQRNKIASVLFEQIWIVDNKVTEMW